MATTQSSHGPVERRWIVLAADGSHSTIGRHSDPSPEEINDAAKALDASRVAGWLAVAEGYYWRKRSRMSLMMVRPLTEIHADWDEAVRAFQRIRETRSRPAA